MSLNTDVKLYLKLLLLTTILLMVRFNGKIIFESKTINTLILVTICLLVFILFAYSFSIRDAAFKTLSVITFGVLSLVSFVTLIVITVTLPNMVDKKGIDLGFECINELKYEDSLIKVYRTNGGATTAFGIVVRKEKQLLPGILFVKEYINMYSIDTIGVRITEQDLLELTRPQLDNVIITTLEL